MDRYIPPQWEQNQARQNQSRQDRDRRKRNILEAIGNMPGAMAGNLGIVPGNPGPFLAQFMAQNFPDLNMPNVSAASAKQTPKQRREAQSQIIQNREANAGRTGMPDVSEESNGFAQRQAQLRGQVPGTGVEAGGPGFQNAIMRAEDIGKGLGYQNLPGPPPGSPAAMMQLYGGGAPADAMGLDRPRMGPPPGMPGPALPSGLFAMQGMPADALGMDHGGPSVPSISPNAQRVLPPQVIAAAQAGTLPPMLQQVVQQVMTGPDPTLPATLPHFSTQNPFQAAAAVSRQMSPGATTPSFDQAQAQAQAAQAPAPAPAPNQPNQAPAPAAVPNDQRGSPFQASAANPNAALNVNLSQEQKNKLWSQLVEPWAKENNVNLKQVKNRDALIQQALSTMLQMEGGAEQIQTLIGGN